MQKRVAHLYQLKIYGRKLHCLNEEDYIRTLVRTIENKLLRVYALRTNEQLWQERYLLYFVFRLHILRLRLGVFK